MSFTQRLWRRVSGNRKKINKYIKHVKCAPDRMRAGTNISRRLVIRTRRSAGKIIILLFRNSEVVKRTTCRNDGARRCISPWPVPSVSVLFSRTRRLYLYRSALLDSRFSFYAVATRHELPLASSPRRRRPTPPRLITFFISLRHTSYKTL